ncbi:CRISPR-associated protein [Clostridium botulinum]|uniref:Crispr-associated ramp protein n=1 Tax=Clostridium botulinum (strain Okra / Type B1) TaxID=498213 RepID=B1IGS2_CLOBK|nr:RAMP superfamily CRISPR-associated protein [Clostridium botulinum]EKX79810.1 CRISPR-associated RAMP protein [Clostridium botulinum CFSAN001628]ACA46374.1 crispr-associated ramp protein [Clostridium botulinum B1 str. Okra]MBD5564008.1 CRISPR-associated protein [Clostridium botulinum]MBD5566621.1 CRISPR-associated protein [Clostridium botulinum]MBD5568863.1 CRISPR-associated protein [Clostridium botulinum]
MSSINKIKQYILQVKNISPLRIGNGEEERNGLLISDKHAIINGTTFSGLFRDFLKKDKVKVNDEEYKLIFPESSNENNKKETSKIYFYDSISYEEIDKKDLCCRNHVRIDEEMGSSVENHLFNEYHISEGKTFQLFFEIRGLDLEEDKYNCLCKHLENFITKLSSGQIAIGSKSSFGFGKFKAIKDNNKSGIYYREYNLLTENGLNNYLDFNFDIKNLSMKGFKNLNVDINNKDSKLKIKLEAYCDEGFIIKGDSIIEKKDKKKYTVDFPYKECINGKGQFIIPSSTIKGVVRGYCNKIFRTLDETGETVINEMFGMKADESEKIEGKKGNLIFEDCKIDGEKLQRYNRIKIDRFTGGVMSGAIFKDQVATVSKDNPIEFNVALNKEDKKMLALIILAFRDIGLGYLTIGSGNNVGYGRFKGKSITISGAGYNSKLEFENFQSESNMDKFQLKGDIDKFNEIISIL